MKKWYGGIVIASLFMLLVLRYGIMKDYIGESFSMNPFSNASKNPLKWVHSTLPPALQNPVNTSQVISTDNIVFSLFAQRNVSDEEIKSLQTWYLLKDLIARAQSLPNGVEAIKEAQSAWNSLMASIEEEKLGHTNDSSNKKAKEKQCPHFLSNVNGAELHNSGFKMRLPCGLTQGSSITIIGIPDGLLGNFRIDLTGEALPGEPDPPFILHYNVRLHGDKITEDPVIVLNTWTVAHEWGEEERCPSPSPDKIKKGTAMAIVEPFVVPFISNLLHNIKTFQLAERTFTCVEIPFQKLAVYDTNIYIQSLSKPKHVSQSKVYVIQEDFGYHDAPEFDDLDQCNKMVGGDTFVPSKHSDGSRRSLSVQEKAKTRRYFPFKRGDLSVATLRVGSEGIQMTVDGKHITSFAFRETLEPWLVSEVRISGDLNLTSVVASSLPTSEDSEHAVDLESLKSPSFSLKARLDLFIGVFSTANNFKRRMAVRRTWMQYDAVRSGMVAVCFFVGLHKNQIVNEELWNEARTYGDIQLMPFVDYYSLITWKTLAICIFGTKVVSAKYVMKTDDDAFVRVDEVLASLKRVKVSHGLLYGLINSDSRPHRSTDSKWYISTEEWPEQTYPPWAHGPGYVISHDIAKAVYKKHKGGHLKMFKLEDVAMGIWIADMKKEGLEVKYEHDGRINNEGCKDGYVVAHYQGPREMLCLWQKLQEGNHAKCCHDR